MSRSVSNIERVALGLGCLSVNIFGELVNDVTSIYQLRLISNNLIFGLRDDAAILFFLLEDDKVVPVAGFAPESLVNISYQFH